MKVLYEIIEEEFIKLIFIKDNLKLPPNRNEYNHSIYI